MAGRGVDKIPNVYTKVRLILFISVLAFSLACSAGEPVSFEKKINLSGKPVSFYIDDENSRIFVIDYEFNKIEVVDAVLYCSIGFLEKSSYPVYLSFSEEKIFVSDFWGYKIDVYNRNTLDFERSVKVKKGPGFSIVNGDRLFVSCQREFALEVLDISSLTVVESYELSGRVPKFYFFDNLLILPYYDNYHTWSKDFEIKYSIGCIDYGFSLRWNIEGMIKKPLNVLKIGERKYLLSGYLDSSIWEADWSKMEVKLFSELGTQNHIMDLEIFGEWLVIPSMSSTDVMFLNISSKEIRKTPCAGGTGVCICTVKVPESDEITVPVLAQ